METPATAAESAALADEALTCLEGLVAAAGELGLRAGQYRQAVAGGGQQVPGGHVLPLEKRLVLVEQMCGAIRALARDGNRFRRMEARVLYGEGLTMAQLAAVFGVSRQRVSALLRESDGSLALRDLDDSEPAAGGLLPGEVA